MLAAHELCARNAGLDPVMVANIQADFEECKNGTANAIYSIIEKNAAQRRFVFTIFNYTTLYKEYARMPRSNIKPSTFFTGFWNKTLQEHSRGILDEADVPDMLTALQETFHPLGYHLSDVSDAERSKHRVLKVTIGRTGVDS